MRKYTKLPLDLAKEIREFADSQLQPISSVTHRARFTMPAGTEFNIDTRVASATVHPSTNVGNITTGSDSLKRSQALYWDDMGRYLDPLRNIYFDRELHLRLDIRSEFSTTSSSTTLPGSYPRLGHRIDSTNSYDSLVPTYINRGTETIDGVTYYTISAFFHINRVHMNQLAAGDRILDYYLSDGVLRFFSWAPTEGSTERRYGASYRMRTLNEVSVSHSPAYDLQHPSSTVLRGTLNHAASNRVYSTEKGYYCGTVNFTNTTLASQFFNVINYPSIYFSTATTAPPTGSVPFQRFVLLPTNTVRGSSSLVISLQITLVSGASTLSVVAGNITFEERQSIYYAQYVSYSSLTSDQKSTLNFPSLAGFSNATTISRGRAAYINVGPNSSLVFLVPTAETATSSVIEIRQV